MSPGGVLSCTTRIAIAAFAAATGIDGFAQVTAVPPARSVPSTEIAKPKLLRLVPANSPRLSILLPSPGVAEKGAVSARNQAIVGASEGSGGKGRPLAIGFARSIADERRIIRGGDLEWITVPGGGFAARVDIVSPGAAALRLSVALDRADTGLTLRFAGGAAGAEMFGPYADAAVADAVSRHGAFWSPVLEGETATIEIHASAIAPPESFALVLNGLSHLVVAGGSLPAIDRKRTSEIGAAGFCEIDVACVAPLPQTLLSAARAVAQTVFTQGDGFTYLCVGNLLNDSLSSKAPLLYTASHCIDSALAAATLNLYWFFDAATCGSRATPPYVLTVGGAKLIARSVDEDWALVRLNAPPPAGATFSAWRAEPMSVGAPAFVLHHPQGDLKKISVATTQPDFYYPVTGVSFIQLIYTQGSTEPGSSGGGVFTPSPAGAFYELRGGLFGGSASCIVTSGYDVFSRLDTALPLLRSDLTPDHPSPTGAVPVVEYWNAGLKHYFMTVNPAEIDDLDSGRHPGWERTGLRFLAWPNSAVAPSGASPVCRFYARPEAGNSHFYSADAHECELTQVRFGNSWTYESPDVFYIQLPSGSSGACPANTRAVWRFFNNVTTNHRYTTDVHTRDDMARPPSVWISEGYGVNRTSMCAPMQ